MRLSSVRAVAAAGLAILAALAFGGPASAQSALCRDPNAFCSRNLSVACLTSLGAGAEAATKGDCRKQLDDYRDCVSAAAGDCVREAAGPTADGACGAAIERELWDLAEGNGDCLDYRAFLEACPRGKRGPFARARLERLGCRAASAAPDLRPDQNPLDRLCARGGAKAPPVGCREHVIARLQGVWLAFGRRVAGKWGAGADCAVGLTFSQHGTTLAVRYTDGDAQEFDAIAMLKNLERKGARYDPAEVVRMSPDELVFEGAEGSGSFSASRFVSRPKDGRTVTLEVEDAAMRFIAQGKAIALKRCR